jgi:hypothetical protein
MRFAFGLCEGQMIAVTRKIFGFCALILLSAGLTACAEEEQNRVLSYEKGTYLGKTDQKLSNDQLRKLVNRSNGQRTY